MPRNRGSFAGRGFGLDDLWPKRFEGCSHWCASGGAARGAGGSSNPIGQIPRGPALSHHKTQLRGASEQPRSASSQSRPMHSAPGPNDVRFSNRPFGVKHFQTIHYCSVDVARTLVVVLTSHHRPSPTQNIARRRNQCSPKPSNHFCNKICH